MGGGATGPSSGSSEDRSSSAEVATATMLRGGWTSAVTNGIGPSGLTGATGPPSVELSESEPMALGVAWRGSSTMLSGDFLVRGLKLFPSLSSLSELLSPVCFWKKRIRY